MNVRADRDELLNYLRARLEAASTATGPHVADDIDTLVRWEAGELTDDERTRLFDHLADCGYCAGVLGDLLAFGFEPNEALGTTVPPASSVPPADDPDAALVERFRIALDAGQRPDPEAVVRGMADDRKKALLKRLRDIHSEYFVGRTLAGRYRLVGLLGHGSMGAVYEAQDLQQGKRRAVKCHFRGGAGRFLFAADALDKVVHENVARFYDRSHDETADPPFLVTELVRGRTLDALRRAGLLPVDAAVRRVREALAGLGALHKKGFVHRDVSPTNIMVEDAPEGVAKVVDLGLVVNVQQAEATPTGQTVCGTPPYWSREQQRGELLDGRSDLFAVGMVLYHLVTGRTPSEDLPAGVGLDAVPERLRPVLARAVAADPDDRYPNAEAFAAALDDFLRAPPPGPEPPPSRRRWLALAALVGGLLAVLLAAWLAWRTLGPKDEVTAEYEASLRLLLKERPGMAVDPRGLSPAAKDVLPYRPNDGIQIVARLEKGDDAYFYLLQIDSAGKPHRLFPAKDTWGRAAGEKPRRILEHPEGGRNAPFEDAPTGIEAFVLLVRHRPLTTEDAEAIAHVFAGIDWEQPKELPTGVTYLLDGEAREYGPLGTARRPRDPVGQTAAALKELLRLRLVDHNSALCYPFRSGKEAPK